MKERSFHHKSAFFCPAPLTLVCALTMLFLFANQALAQKTESFVDQPYAFSSASLPSLRNFLFSEGLAQAMEIPTGPSANQAAKSTAPLPSPPDSAASCQTLFWYLATFLISTVVFAALVLLLRLRFCKHCLQGERFLWQAINKALVDGVCVVNNQGLLCQVNPAFCTLFGYSEEELLGHSAHDFFASRQETPGNEQEDSPFYIALKKKENFDGIGDFRTKDDVLLYIEINARPIIQPHTIAAILITLRDVTLSKRHLEHLSQSEKKNRMLSSALEHIPVSVLITDLQGIVEYANPKFIEETGYIAKDIIGTTPQFMESDSLKNGAYSQIWQAVHSGKEWKGEVSNRRVNGKISREMISVSPIRDKDGDISHFVVVEEDITKRRDMEENLREQELIQRTLMESMPVGVMIVDAATRKIEMINTFGANMLEREKEEILGNYCYNLLCPASMMACPIIDLEPSVEISDRIMLRADGAQISVLKTVRKVSIKGEQKFLECFVDIQERKQTEEALKKANQQMEVAIDRAETMTREAKAANRSKSAFLANMSHEIRTPMNAVLGMTHLALGTNLTPQQRNYLEKVDLSAKSLLNILNDILDFSQIEAGRVELKQIPFDLNEVLDNLITVIGTQLHEKPIEFLVDVHVSAPTLLIGDPLRLSQILINLTGNAVKFTERGKIRVGVRAEYLDGNKLARLCFEVQDTGMGISAQHKQELFRPFMQGDTSISRRYGGTGLGLSISHQLIRLMGGTIQVDSAPNQGSLFAFDAYFGLQEPAPDTLLLPEPLRQWKVLVLDGHNSARRILADYLHALHLSVLEAASGEQALELLRQDVRSTAVDVVLVASQLPDMEAAWLYHAVMTDALILTKPNMALIRPFAYEQEHPKFPVTLTKPVTMRALVAALCRIADIPDQEEAITPSSACLNFTGAKVLLAEDNEINQMVAQEILEHAGIVLTLAQNGQEAVDLVRNKTFDLVLMDIQMPVMDGFEATMHIRELLGKSLPIIAMTAYVTREEQEQIVAAGMDGHIGKPIDINMLFSVLSRWLSKYTDHPCTTREAGATPAASQDLASQQREEPPIQASAELDSAIDQLADALQSCKPKKCIEAVDFLQKNFSWLAKYERTLTQIGKYASNYEFAQARPLVDSIRAMISGKRGEL